MLTSCRVEETRLRPVGLQSRGTHNEFPDFLVGVWKADGFKWGFKFEPDGTISKIEHVPAGKIVLAEGGREMEGPDEGTYAVFIMGPCDADYDAAKRELSVKIVLDFFRMKLPTGTLEGRQVDYFDGPVSEDENIWRVKWRCYSWLEGAAEPDPNLIEANPEPLVFRKVDFRSVETRPGTEVDAEDPDRWRR